MGIIQDIQRKRRYGELRGLTKERMLQRLDIKQLQTFYSAYVNPQETANNAKKPVEELTVLSIANDFMNSHKGAKTGRAKYIEEIETNVSFDEIAAYCKKIKVNVSDILAEYEERKEAI